MIVLTATVECEGCGEPFDGEWDDVADDVQDVEMNDPAEQVCPGCGHRQWLMYPGWTFRTEAG